MALKCNPCTDDLYLAHVCLQGRMSHVPSLWLYRFSPSFRNQNTIIGNLFLNVFNPSQFYTNRDQNDSHKKFRVTSNWVELKILFRFICIWSTRRVRIKNFVPFHLYLKYQMHSDWKLCPVSFVFEISDAFGLKTWYGLIQIRSLNLNPIDYTGLHISTFGLLIRKV